MTHFKAFAKLTAFFRLKNYSVCDINHGIGSKGINYFDYSFLTPGFSVLAHCGYSIADCAFVIDCFTVLGHRLRDNFKLKSYFPEHVTASKNITR